MGIIPPNTLAESSAPFADAAEHIAGESFRKIVAFGAVIATMGAFLMAISLATMKAGRRALTLIVGFAGGLSVVTGLFWLRNSWGFLA